MVEYILQIIGLIAGATAVYSAIRSDLATIREKAEHAAVEASKAHERIDSMLMSRMRDIQ